MNYDIANRRETRIYSSVQESQGMPYGEIPFTMLTQKFESTDGVDPYLPEDADGIGAAQLAYDNFARKQLMDNGPDSSSMEHEQNRSSKQLAQNGFLNLIHGGHRGQEEGPEHPEMFLSFTDKDPRGHVTEVNPQKLADQARFRTSRYQHFNKDHADQITGGGVNEAQIMQMKQDVFRQVRGRMKTFDRQLAGYAAGRGAVGDYKEQKSRIAVTQNEDERSERSLDNIGGISNHTKLFYDAKLVRSTSAFQLESDDANYTAATYISRTKPNQLGRKDNRQTASSEKQQMIAKDSSEFSGSDVNVAMKSACQIMKRIIDGSAQDVDLLDSGTTVATKTVEKKQQEHTLRQVVDTIKHGVEDIAQGIRSVNERMDGELIRKMSIEQHELPAATLLNIDIIRRAGRAESEVDKQKILQNIVTSHKPEEDFAAYIARNAKNFGGDDVRKVANFAAGDAEKAPGNDAKSQNYKTKIYSGARKNMATVDNEAAQFIANEAQAKKLAAQQYMNNMQNHSFGQGYGDNKSIERYAAPLGRKSNVRRYTMSSSSFGDKFN